MPGPTHPAMKSVLPAASARTAQWARRAASSRSNALGAPPRTTWPSTETRVSTSGSVIAMRRSTASLRRAASTFTPSAFTTTTRRLRASPLKTRSIKSATCSTIASSDLLDLGHERRVGERRDRARHREITRVAAHHLDHERAPMRRRRIADAIAGLDDRVHRGVDADGHRRAREVVVDRGGQPRDGDARVRERVRAGERAIAADHERGRGSRLGRGFVALAFALRPSGRSSIAPSRAPCRRASRRRRARACRANERGLP